MDFERGTQLKGYIQREVKDKKMHSNYGYTYYFCRDFLSRIFGSNPDSFILKGSFSQFSHLKTAIRPLTDIDIVTPINMEEANQMILSLMEKNENIKYSVKQKFVTTNATINYKLLCEFDKIQHVITMDLRRQENLLTTENELPIYFGKDKPFSATAITLEEHLSNKIYISLLMLRLNEKLGKEFRRFKDFYDIYGILQLGNIDVEKVREFLLQRIKRDGFLYEYDLQGNLFTSNFIKENEEEWKKESSMYGFNKDVLFEQSVETTNEMISKLRR